MGEYAQALADFLDSSPSSYHAVENLRKILENAGYVRLFQKDSWEIRPGGKYYVLRNDSAILAFRIPEGEIRGFMMAASHSDRPSFKIKENPELSSGPYLRLAVEPYGGMIISSWMDRPLSVAGRVLVQTANGIESRLVNIDRDLLLIPSVAIHMNREVNRGYAYNPAVDLLPLYGPLSQKGKFMELLAACADTVPEHILGSDLYLYVRSRASLWGDYISAQGLDDLQCAFGCMTGFLSAKPGQSISLCCVFDNEEVGSGTWQGADSDLLKNSLERVCAALSLDYSRMLSGSFLASADNAHAIHPNHPEFADGTAAPVLNGGVVLKFNAAQRYATDGLAAALFRKACAQKNIPVQAFCNRADMPGGSTLGHISTAQVSVPTADVGLAQLAMHSAYETAGAEDIDALVHAMESLFSMSYTLCGNGITIAFS